MTDDLTAWIMMWRNLRSEMMNAVGSLVYERAKLFDGDALSILAELDAAYNQWLEDERDRKRGKL